MPKPGNIITQTNYFRLSKNWTNFAILRELSDSIPRQKSDLYYKLLEIDDTMTRPRIYQAIDRLIARQILSTCNYRYHVFGRIFNPTFKFTESEMMLIEKIPIDEGRSIATLREVCDIGNDWDDTIDRLVDKGIVERKLKELVGGNKVDALFLISKPKISK